MHFPGWQVFPAQQLAGCPAVTSDLFIKVRVRLQAAINPGTKSAHRLMGARSLQLQSQEVLVAHVAFSSRQ